MQRVGLSPRARLCSRSLTVAGCALFAFGCSDASHRLGGVPLLCSEGATSELIDSMEDGNMSIDFTEGRSGFWFAYNNGTGVQVPPANGEVFAMDALSPARAGSRYAVRTYGSGFTGEWGAGIGCDLHSKASYDASRYAGIAFWARAAVGSSTSLRVALPDRNTDATGGVCDAAAALCDDSFGADLELGNEWRYFELSWSELWQRGWSGVRLDSVARDALYGLRFQSEPLVHFDFSIDDLAFLCPAH